MTEWNNQLLGIVGGGFSGLSYEGYANTAIMGRLTNGVDQVFVSAASVAVGGTSLFDQNFATLWGSNVLTVLDVGLFGDYSWNTGDNARFAQNVANWIATPVPIPSTLLLLGSGILGLIGIRTELTRNKV